MSKPLIIGHRGAKGHVFENTLASIEKAFELGADGIEIDVHICHTGEIIVFHDLDLRRVFNDNRTISELSFTEIRNLKLDDKHQIPTLSDVLEILPKKSILNIELKGRGTAEPVFILLQKTKHLPDKIILSSFYKRELEAYRLLDASAKLGVFTNFDFVEAIAFAKKINAFSVHPHFSLLNKKTAQIINDLGCQIFTWTVNNSEEIQRIKQFNVEGIITDYPDRI